SETVPPLELKQSLKLGRILQPGLVTKRPQKAFQPLARQVGLGNMSQLGKELKRFPLGWGGYAEPRAQRLLIEQKIRQCHLARAQKLADIRRQRDRNALPRPAVDQLARYPASARHFRLGHPAIVDDERQIRGGSSHVLVD